MTIFCEKFVKRQFILNIDMNQLTYNQKFLSHTLFVFNLSKEDMSNWEVCESLPMRRTGVLSRTLGKFIINKQHDWVKLIWYIYINFVNILTYNVQTILDKSCLLVILKVFNNSMILKDLFRSLKVSKSFYFLQVVWD